MYSAPEPPAPVRRSRVLVLLAAVAALVMVAGAVYFLVPGDEGERVASAVPPERDGGRDRNGEGPPAAPGEDGPSPDTAQPGTEPSGAASPPAAEPIGSLPPACGTVPAGTVRSLIPKAQRRESSNQTLTTCTYSSGGDAFRWLRVEAHLYAPANTPTPVDDARRYFGAQWAQAHNSPLERTVSLARHSGMGDEAYRWYKADRGQPTVVGQVTVRLRNVVVTVSYSEQARGKGAAEARERECLGKATRVAGEVLRGFR
ncbi:hypothetical protein ACFY4C_05590 [Actinomadura viridis]|uniref:hypothetical protein n=1 Tax=Actinomadura viridis TaxID=58110 RepID=UPI00368D54FF